MLLASRPLELGQVALPDKVDHRDLLRPVRDQGQEGSCFAHSTAALKEYNCARWEMAHGKPALPVEQYLSVAYLSWRTRLATGTFPVDSGASIADVMGVLQGWGACPESFLPYDQDASQAGNAQCDVAARPYRASAPATVPIAVDAWKAVLAAGHCINIGFEVYQSFEATGADGIVPTVQPGEGVLGGHAVLVVGCGVVGGEAAFVVRNSWGPGWGDGGYCYFHESYLQHVWECWTTTAPA